MPTASGRIRELDGLRGLAALAVVLFHYTSRYDALFGHTTPLWLSFPRGDLGVDFFFMLSGYVILLTIDRTTSAGEFIIGRFARLYPTYWAAALVTFSIVILSGLPGQVVSLSEAVVNATMFQQLLGARHIDSAYWSLQTELLFYAAIFALARMGMLSPSRWSLTIALWLLTSAAARLMATPTAAADGPLGLVTKLQTALSLKYLHLFVIGIIVRRTENAGRWSPVAWSLMATCILIQGLVDSWTAAGVVALMGLVLREAVHRRVRFLAAGSLVFLGIISYPLYLIHQNVGYVIIGYLEAAGMGASLSVMAAIGGSLLLATGLWLCVERPAAGTIKRWFEGSRRRTGSACMGGF